MSKLKNIHPGEILKEEFLIPMSLSQNKLAKAVAVPPRRINEIVLEKRRITADTDLKLAKFFGTSPGFWMNLQQEYDLEKEREHIQKILNAIHQYHYAYNGNNSMTQGDSM